MDATEQKGADAADERAITGEIADGEDETLVSPQRRIMPAMVQQPETVHAARRRAYLLYLILPAIFLTVALLGGLRLAGSDGAFIFLKPSLFCLISATILMVLFFRARLIEVSGWFAEDLTTLKNVANGVVLLTLFAAATQLFNSLLPESGLMFWVVAFCFFWTLWNNLFAEFDTLRLIRSLGALFGMAFIVKYVLLAYFSAPSDKYWLRAILEDPVQEATVALLDLPRFAAGTGYLQFFAVGLFLLGLYMLPSSTRDDR